MNDHSKSERPCQYPSGHLLWLQGAAQPNATHQAGPAQDLTSLRSWSPAHTIPVLDQELRNTASAVNQSLKSFQSLIKSFVEVSMEVVMQDRGVSTDYLGSASH